MATRTTIGWKAITTFRSLVTKMERNDFRAHDAGPLTVVVTWRVRRECEEEFEAWRREMSAAALKFPGHMGIEVLRPSSNDY